jgi:dynein heavy chain
VVEGTLDIYQKVISSLLPTPTKSHYTFNLRDISRVMQGFLMMRPQQLGTGATGKEKYTRLWTNEVGGSPSSSHLTSRP